MISLVRRNGGDDSNDVSCCNDSGPDNPSGNNTNAGGSRLVARNIPGYLDHRAKVTTSVIGLPEGHDKATTYGNGKKSPIVIKSGPRKGWHAGGGLRKHVYGYTFHPRVPALMTLPWGFVPIATFLDTYPSDSNLHRYYESLPQNATRPGGELLEMKVTPLNNTIPRPYPPIGIPITPMTPFFVVADNYTVHQIRGTLIGDCFFAVDVSAPIPFNSTGNLQLGSVVQYYRGDSAAVLLQGYENAKESPNSPNLVPNPPFPQGVSRNGWNCMNKSIGESIPLMYSGPSHKTEKFAGGMTVTGFVLILVCIIIFVDRKKEYHPIDSEKREE